MKLHMLNQIQITEIKQLISKTNKIVLISHTNPDGDAVGSILAMYHFLNKLDKEVDMLVPNKFPDFYSWLPDSDKIILYDKQHKLAQKKLNDADIIFALDFNSFSRMGALADVVRPTRAKRLLIDHHIDPDIASFDYCYSRTDVSSTAELVYEFISILGYGEMIDKKISEAIYTGIVTDTGSFSFSCNRPETYDITSNLVRQGVDAQKIHKLIYDTFSENRLRLLGFAISQRMLVWDEFHTALIYLTKEDLRNHNYQVGDTEGMVNYPLSMNKVNMSVLITERDNQLRLSFRSKGKFSVNELCRNHFNGGGHRNAAGGKTQEDMETFISRLKKVLAEYKNDLDYRLEL